MTEGGNGFLPEVRAANVSMKVASIDDICYCLPTR